MSADQLGSPRRRSACPGKASGRAAARRRCGRRRPRRPRSLRSARRIEAARARAICFRCLNKPDACDRDAPRRPQAATKRRPSRTTASRWRCSASATRNLKLIERETGAQMHSRGNELTIVGARRPRGARARADRAALRHGPRRGAHQPRGHRPRGGVLRGGQRASTCATSSTTRSWSRGRARPIAPKGLAQKRYVDAIRAARHRLRHRAGGHRQDLPGDGAGGARAHGEAGQAHRPDPPGRRGGRAARLPARQPWRRRSTPYLRPLYDALHDMMDFERADQLVARGPHRGRADRLHARPHAQRRVRHPRRGAEHDQRADEDVPDPPRLRVQGGDHRRRHADRSARQPPLGPERGDASCSRASQGIAFCYFTEVDVVRHPLVQQIIKAYDAGQAAPAR